MNAYFVSKLDDSTSFEFCVNAYPKVRAAAGAPARRPRARALCGARHAAHPPTPPTTRTLTAPCCSLLLPRAPPLPLQSLVCRASSSAEMEEWINALMGPMQELARAPNAPSADALAGGASA